MLFAALLSFFASDTVTVTPSYLKQLNAQVANQTYLFEIKRSNMTQNMGTFDETFQTDRKTGLIHRLQIRTVVGRTETESTYFKAGSFTPVSRTLISPRGNMSVHYQNGAVMIQRQQGSKLIQDTTPISADIFDGNYIDYIIAVLVKSDLKLYKFNFFSPSIGRISTWTVQNHGSLMKEINGTTQQVYHASTEQRMQTMTITSNYYVNALSGALVLEEHTSPRGTTRMLRTEKN